MLEYYWKKEIKRDSLKKYQTTIYIPEICQRGSLGSYKHSSITNSFE